MKNKVLWLLPSLSHSNTMLTWSSVKELNGLLTGLPTGYSWRISWVCVSASKKKLTWRAPPLPAPCFSNSFVHVSGFRLYLVPIFFIFTSSLGCVKLFVASVWHLHSSDWCFGDGWPSATFTCTQHLWRSDGVTTEFVVTALTKTPPPSLIAHLGGTAGSWKSPGCSTLIVFWNDGGLAAPRNL